MGTGRALAVAVAVTKSSDYVWLVRPHRGNLGHATEKSARNMRCAFSFKQTKNSNTYSSTYTYSTTAVALRPKIHDMHRWRPAGICFFLVVVAVVVLGVASFYLFFSFFRVSCVVSPSRRLSGFQQQVKSRRRQCCFQSGREALEREKNKQGI